MPLLLNGFPLKLSATSFSAYAEPFPENQDLKATRERLGDEWFLHWREGKLYGIPVKSSISKPFGKRETILVADNMGLLRARLNDLLPSLFQQYEPIRQRPFAFLGKKREIVGAIRESLPGKPEILKGFSIRPRYALETKVVETREDEVRLAIFLTVNTRWEILEPLERLSARGLDLTGLHVIRRIADLRQRRLVGRIAKVQNGTIILSESFDGATSCRTEDVLLEGSRESFSRCLKGLLSPEQYLDFERLRSAEDAKLLTGPAVKKGLEQMGEFLKKVAPIRVTDDLTVSVEDILTFSNGPAYQSVFKAKPDTYCFDPGRSKRSSYAWPGLERYGPFDKDSFAKKTPRIVVVCTDEDKGRVEQVIRQFRDGLGASRGPRYAAGFATTFSLINPSFTFWTVPWVERKDASISDAYRRVIDEGLARDADGFQLAFVVVPDRYAFLPDAANPYLHAKAAFLLGGVPVQEARLATLSVDANSLQYTLQNLAVASYAKMGGTPWTIDQDLAVNDEIVLGMGFCELSGSRFQSKQRHVGITTVFRGDGSYLLSNLSRECGYDDYPEVLRESTVGVLEEIKKRNGWSKGDTVRIVFHAQKPLKNIEVDEIVADCVAAVGAEQHVEFAFLTVSMDHPFLVIDTEQEGYKGKGELAPERGTIAQLGRFTRMVSATGPRLIKRPQSPLPSPLLVHLHPRSTYRDLSYLSEQVLKFTSLSWRSTLPARQPVTIYYSELIANLLGRLRTIPGWSPLILNSKLRASRWFL